MCRFRDAGGQGRFSQDLSTHFVNAGIASHSTRGADLSLGAFSASASDKLCYYVDIPVPFAVQARFTMQLIPASTPTALRR